VEAFDEKVVSSDVCGGVAAVGGGDYGIRRKLQLRAEVVRLLHLHELRELFLRDATGREHALAPCLRGQAQR
jgi:hypothetical protein